MSSLQQLETTLDGVLNKNAPVKIPPEGRKSLAGALWWIALIVGVLQLWSAITLWQWGHAVDRLADTLSYYSSYAAPHLGLFYYLSLLAMAITAVLALIAVPSLKAMKKSGWDLLFYCSLISAILAVLRLFSGDGGFLDFIGTAAGTVVGAWLLFQARDFFMADVSVVSAREHTTAKAPASAAETKEKPAEKPTPDSTGKTQNKK